MPLLSCTNIQYSIGTRVLLDGISFSIEPGQRIGLVGRNGCGKTTFLRMLAGRAKPDLGSVSLQKGARMGYLTQDPELNLENTLRAEAAAGFIELGKMHIELDEIYHQMALPENADPVLMQRLMDRQSDIQHKIEELGGYDVDHKVDAVLHGLGFVDSQFGVPVSKLSGGQKGRLALAKLLLESPDILLLDEPTNHLDIAGREWLEDFLVNDFKGAVLIISHDRYVLDRVVHGIEELERGRLIDYPGNYTAFIEIRRERLKTQQRAYENQQSEWAKEEEFIRRFKAGQRAKEAQGRLSKLERQKELFAIERVAEMGAARFGFPEAPRSGDHVAVVREGSKKYTNVIDEENNTPHDKVLFHELNVTIQRGERWAVIGPNGAGKTTLIRCILGQVPMDSGVTKLGSNVVIGYYAQLPPEEDGDLAVYQYLQTIIRRENEKQIYSEQQARDLAGAFLFAGRDQDKQLKVLSGGERSRARLAGLLASAKNLIILDEPTNHLDIPSAERLEQALHVTPEGDGFGGTLLLISHDRALIDATCDHLIIMDGKGNTEVFTGTYTEYHRKKSEQAREQAKLDQERARKQAKAGAQVSKPAGAPKQQAKAEARQPSAGNGHSQKKGARGGGNGGGGGGGRGLSWMPDDRLEKDIASLSGRLKELDDDLAKEEVYRDAALFKKTLQERDTAQADLERHEAEWLRRAEA
ncbi:MAG TPA: ABC-F family ATP-binding cassette domain-containing protein [Phycisphaerales bacterium]|nr:ABC-F family ATP-binding cassette domain-containing protein [Phycisphaerales bacterium]